MKKLLVTILLTFISTSAMAEWTKLGGTDDSDEYIDFSTKRKIGNKVKIWSLRNYKTPQNDGSGEYLSSVMQYEFDCASENYKFLTITDYKENMQEGDVVVTVTPQPEKSRIRSIAPNTVAELKFKSVCGKK